MSFQNLGLSDDVLRGVKQMGYNEPSAIQLRTIPQVLAGHDIIASAPTGTGKTAAFALPILSAISAIQQARSSGLSKCLVLEPTRELAMQVETTFRDYSRFMKKIDIALIHGGVGYTKQANALKHGFEIIIATPGRLVDFIEKKMWNPSGLSFLVLDEVDRMLDIGFLPVVRQIIEYCPQERQTLLFTATLPDEIDVLSRWCLKNPTRIQIGVLRTPAESVNHSLYPVASDQKFALLKALLEQINFDSVLIFCKTKHGVDRIARQLKGENHSVAVLHSNRTQRERMEALDGFKKGLYEVMVATDIAARGIDIAGISHVINFDIPQHPEDYVHRIGRTGRALAVGDALTIITAEDLKHLYAIEKFIGCKIKRTKLENFPYIYSTILEDKPYNSPTLQNKRSGGRRMPRRK